MFNQEAIRSDDFEQISDIREVIYQEKVEECERLKCEMKAYKESSENWKAAYECTWKRFLQYLEVH